MNRMKRERSNFEREWRRVKREGEELREEEEGQGQERTADGGGEQKVRISRRTGGEREKSRRNRAWNRNKDKR